MTGLRNMDWVMNGAPNLVRYVFSGVIERGYLPWNFIVRNVPAGSLFAPPGWEVIKWALGQRIYIP